MSSTVELVWKPIHPHPSWPDAKTDPVLWLDTAAFDAEWRLGDRWVGPQGVPGGHGSRYPRAGEWILSGRPIDMLQIWVNEGGVGFTDGRHRFAWLRDHGVGAIAVQLSPESLAFGAARFESKLRKSVLARQVG